MANNGMHLIAKEPAPSDAGRCVLSICLFTTDTNKLEQPMNLAENEKRDIIKFIESEKPLPGKYRYLLFDDKREVELV